MSGPSGSRQGSQPRRPMEIQCSALRAIPTSPRLQTPPNTATNGHLFYPAFNFPCEVTYPTELDILEEEAPASHSAELYISALAITNSSSTQNRLLVFSQRSHSQYTAISRPWECQQLLNTQKSTKSNCNTEGQHQLIAWEAQSSAEEPFNCVGEVIVGNKFDHLDQWDWRWVCKL
ncbi:uncharacterized protein PAC_14362 [Phialocephala subalpina]|uniref:Uncharacterized protein n=1 Tax=Phialocephala subalpina TaxID=576137 RepID=A0A1L7XHG1_9HELO|nr:uncharacterized protein PAC_14362 [Phialocephala subalpina]